MFEKILIANRGEIAVRIIRACKELGIKVCTIHSHKETTSPHVYLADESYLVESNYPIEAYLNIDRIIEVAEKNEVDAIHPGYGFLSENAEFINALSKTSITFIGPDAGTVEMMGNKVEARKFVQSIDVPVIPGSVLPCRTVEEVIEESRSIGYPVMLKASAGGGGKGMRVVYREQEIERAFVQASEEAQNAFGDGSMYVEKFLESPRHIEVQVIGDHHGSYVHLFERECSVQRRHQKIIEEAPANLNSDLKNEIYNAGISIAKSCGYKNAGTIEFLVQGDDFYFLEANTRLQVEHPVTEGITGIDIVKEQISIASGAMLSIKQDDITCTGHSIECRINSEDPFNSFFPSIGRITYYSIPAGNGIRVDSGVKQDSKISTDFDPLMAKLICTGNTRDEAIERMKIALKTYRISGVLTNIPFHLQILNSNEFSNATYNIDFIGENVISLLDNIQNDDSQSSKIAAVLGAFQKSSEESLKVIRHSNTMWGRNG